MNIPDAVKIAAFDALVKTMGSPGKYVRTMRVQVSRPTSLEEMLNTNTSVHDIAFKDVPIYGWVFHAPGTDDFCKALIELAKK